MTHLLLLIIYLAFISLGLPDGLLGGAWPSMYQELDVPVSFAGFISMIICLGTVISSLQSDRLTKALGTGKVTAFSVLLTAVSLFGFSVSHEFWMLLLWSLPYGLGAGCIDASLNNYAAIHFASRHMSWLHCMWGVGAALGPVVLGFVLTSGGTWNGGYLVIGCLQVALAIVVFLSLPLWKRNSSVNPHLNKTDSMTPAAESPISTSDNQNHRPLKLREVMGFSGVKAAMLTFVAYSGVEQTTTLWAGSYFVFHDGISPDIAASLVGLFYLGITVGRAICGFLTLRFDDKTLVRVGEVIVAAAIILMFLPIGSIAAYGGVLMIGFGCSPIFPCLVHATPLYFGADKSQAVIGAEMASAYSGTLVLPPLFGAISTVTTVAAMPIYLAGFLVLIVIMHERLLRQTSQAIGRNT